MPPALISSGFTFSVMCLVAYAVLRAWHEATKG